jgi:hypothetical protein
MVVGIAHSKVPNPYNSSEKEVFNAASAFSKS